MAAWSLPVAALAGWGLSLLHVSAFLGGVAATLVFVAPPLAMHFQAVRKHRGALLLTQDALESVAIPLLVANEHLDKAHANWAFCSLLGLPDTEFKLDTLPAELAEVVLPAMQTALAGSPSAGIEFWFQCVDRGAVYVRSNSVRVEDSAGDYHVVVYLEDLTERETSKLKVQQCAEKASTFLQRLIDVIPHPVYVKNADGRLVTVNDAYAAEWGVARGELIGRTVLELAPDNPRAVLVAGEDEYVLAHGHVRKEERYPLWASGIPRWRIVSKGTCLDADGNTVIVGADFDITEQRQLERDLQQALDIQTQTRSFLQSLFNALPNPVSVKDQHLRFIMTNESWLQTFGMRAVDLGGVSPIDLVATRGGQAHMVDVERELLACPDGTVRDSELSIAREFGAVQSFILRETVITDMDNGRAILCVYSDVSNIKAAEADSIHAREAAERANEAKSLFLANMSHELRTPMHAVLSFARLGQEKTALQPGMGRYRSYFERIVVAGERLMLLLDDLLDLSKLESGRANLEYREVDLGVVVHEALAELNSMFGMRRQRAISHFLEVSKLRGDTVRLGQVVRNLLSNASKYSPDGGEIEIYLRMAGSAQVELVVADSGIGIPERELESVFDKFAQSSLTRTGAGGTGLGLAICREIVSLHGGEIFARNRPGPGAELVVRLPVCN